MFNIRTSSSVSPSLGGRLAGSVFGLVFAGFAVVFMGLIARDGFRDTKTRSWKATPAVVLSSEVRPREGSGGKHRFVIRYEYDWDGNRLTGESLRQKPLEDDDINMLEKLAMRFPAGAQVTCYVNPTIPAEAVLEHGGFGTWFAMLFGLPFLGIGLGVIYASWRRPKSSTETEPEGPLSRKAAGSAGCLVLFFSVFALFGFGFFFFFFLKPLWGIATARNWIEVPCIVEASQVRSHSSDDGTTYSVDVLYRYEFEGRVLRSNRHSFVTGSSSGRDGKLSVVRQFPVGRETVCYVNPSDPTDAVLERGFTRGMLWGLFPLIFVAVGVGGMIFAIRKARQARSGTLASQASATSTLPSPVTGERLLKARHGPWKRLLGGLLFCLFWNGIVSIFVWNAIESFRRGRPEWFLAVFMIPFVLVGLGLLAYVVYAFLGLFNPRPRLRLRPGTPRLGESLNCDWEIAGAVGRIQRFSISIEGVEEATYKRGTNTHIEKSVFVRLPVVEMEHAWEFAQGGVTALVPDNCVPSFKADNNRIFWQLKLHGEIARWPDVKEEYEIQVLPLVGGMDRGVRPTSPLHAEQTLKTGGSLELALQPEDGLIQPGGTLTGQASWSLGTLPRGIEVKLLWFTRGKGTTDVIVVAGQELPGSAMGEASFKFDLPTHPLSFDGALVSIVWAVELIIDPGEYSVRVEFPLCDGEAPVRLEALPGKLEEVQKRWNRRG